MLIPNSLSELPQFVLWRYEDRGDKPTKVPYRLPDAKGLSYPASSTDPSTWTDYDAALNIYNSAPEFWAGIGFVFSPDDPYCGIDLDKCLENGKVKPWAVPILERFADSYSEISPSGTGIKIWARGKLPGNGTAFEYGDGRIEVYDHARYFAVTGRHWVDFRDIEEHQKDLEWLLTLSPHGQHKVPHHLGAKIPKGTQHDSLVSLAGSMRVRGATTEAIEAALQIVNRDQCEEPGPPENISRIARDAGRWEPGPPKKRVNGAPVPVPEESPPVPDTREKARLAIAAVVEAKDAAKCWDDEFISIIAAAGTGRRFDAIRAFKAAYPKDFVGNIRAWEAKVDEAEAAIRQSQSEGGYLTTEKGVLRVVVANAITMMAELPLEWNSFTCRAFLTSPAPWGSSGNWTDRDDIYAAEWCQRQGLHIPPPVAMDASIAISYARKPHYHPVTSYLEPLTWDGTPRIDRWLYKYLGTPDNKYTRAVAAMWTISAVKRAFEPGCQADYTLVLEGSQGKKKSSALRALAGSEWFSDDIADIGSKDSAIQLQGKWIVEIAELDAFKRAEITTIKAWLVRREDHFRPPYGRRAEDFPRQNVFAASTNKEDWGMDDSGLRRFWPVRCGEIRTEALTEDRDQLWAEAVHRYRAGERTWMDEEMEAAAREEQSERQEIDPWNSIIQTWLEHPLPRMAGDQEFNSRPDAIFLPDILRSCLAIPEKDWNKGHRDRVTRVLRLSGYDTYRATRKDSKGKRPEYWRPVQKG